MNKSFFTKNPGLKEYFETADGIKFFNESAAKNHARAKKLDIKNIKHVKNNTQEEGAPETAIKKVETDPVQPTIEKVETDPVQSTIEKVEGAPVVNAGDEKGTIESSTEGAAVANAAAANQGNEANTDNQEPVPQEQEKPKKSTKNPKAK